MNQRPHAFSLVEVVVSLGVIAFALLAIVGLLPVGFSSARDSIDATRTSAIAEDVISRIRATLNSNDTSSPYYFSPYAGELNSFFYYDRQGARVVDGAKSGELIKVPFVTGDSPNFYSTTKTLNDYYRAKVHVATFDQTPNYPMYDPRYAPAGSTSWQLLCATVEIGWPVNTSDGSIVSATNRANYTFTIRKP